MKRADHLFEQIVEPDNVRRAFHRAARGKWDREEVRLFAASLDESLGTLRRDLLKQRLELGHSSTFTIYDPKQRTITAPCFRERVLHHAIIRICEPFFERFLIADTYACRTGKGRISALHRAECFTDRFPYALKLDMRKYFNSVPHELLLERLQRRFKDQRLLALFRQIVCSQGSEGRGLPIGSLTSQHFANFYLGWFDRHVKEHMQLRGYVRYMDDCLIWADRRSALLETADGCREFLQRELKLTVREDTPIYRSANGIDFLGCRVFRDHLKLNRRSRRRFRAKFRELEEQFVIGTISERELQRRSEALTAFTKAGNVRSWNFRQQVLQQGVVSGHGLEPGEPGRQLEQRLRELPFGEPQQEHAGQPEQQQRLSCAPQLRSRDGCPFDGTDHSPV